MILKFNPMIVNTEILPFQEHIEFYNWLFQHYKSIFQNKLGSDLYFYSTELEKFDDNLPLFPRISEKRKPLNYIITHMYRCEKLTLKINNELPTPFRLGRNIIGSNLIIPTYLPKNSFTVFAGYKIAPLLGGGSRDTWECRNGIWGKAKMHRTWIS